MQAERNRQIMQSIDYASTIQRAMLRPSRDALLEALRDASLVWEPRDTVGGDFYHFARCEDGWFAAIGDCTGHGVPGAFMTLIASTILNQALAQHGPRSPAALLMAVNQGIKQMLGQVEAGRAARESDDGMDAAFFWYDRASGMLTFAGAKCGLLLLNPGDADFTVVDGDRVSVGYVDTGLDYHWLDRTVPTQAGTLVFVTTDGLIDQIGGARDIAFGKRRVREAVLARRDAPAAAVAQSVLEQLRLWQGEHHRRDDLTFLCFRIQASGGI
jgi:serine phosphatase RsbU (regulator of sigma subunit)